MHQRDPYRMDCEVAIREGRRGFEYCEEWIYWEEAEGVAGGKRYWIRRVLVSNGGADKNGGIRMGCHHQKGQLREWDLKMGKSIVAAVSRHTVQGFPCSTLSGTQNRYL